jgi:hypothetical protein
MQRSLLAFWLTYAIVCAVRGTSAQPLDPASLSKQAEIHSVVVDMPEVVTLSGASPDSWATLPSPTEERRQAPMLEANAWTRSSG